LGAFAGSVALFVGVLSLILPHTRVPLTRILIDLSYDLPFLFRRNQPIDDVTIVYMDVPSEDRLRQERSRWNRNLHADLLHVLRRAGAKVVAFDAVFTARTTPAADSNLVFAAKAHGRVAVAAMIGPTFIDGMPVESTLWQPFSELGDVTVWGMAEVADETGGIREHVSEPSFKIPSLAWRVAELTGAPAVQPPADPYAPRWLNYYGENGYIPHVSYADVLATNADVVAMVSNKVVFVGAWWVVGFRGGKGTDDYRTPHTWATGRRMAGVEVCATAYLNLARNDWLRRWPPIIEAGVIALCGLAAGLAMGQSRPVTAAVGALVGMLVITILGLMSPWITGYWIPWVVPVAVQLPVALAIHALGYTRRLQRDKRSLEQTLAIARGGAMSAEPVASAAPRPAAGPSPIPQASPDRWSPVGIGSSARPSGPSAAVGDLLEASGGRVTRQPAVPDHELIRRIGRGAYGEVWLGRDIIGSYHAVKLVFRDAFKEIEPFEREFNGLRRFTPISRQHAGLVHVLQVGRNERDGYLYYVMELGDDVEHGQKIQPSSYVPRTLSTALREGRRLPMIECLDIGIHLANALEFLHQHQLIHRDIKPSNIIFVNGVSKFADIGLVTDVASDGKDVSYLGTKGYIAPEGPGTPAADVYSLGKVIYQMGFGLDVSRFPELPTEVVVDPEETALFGLNRVVMTSCESRVEARYSTAAAFGQALAELKGRLEGRTP
jgi:CHASE2 domain-containing sensor protein